MDSCANGRESELLVYHRTHGCSRNRIPCRNRTQRSQRFGGSGRKNLATAAGDGSFVCFVSFVVTTARSIPLVPISVKIRVFRGCTSLLRPEISDLGLRISDLNREFTADLR